jgi:tRNA(Ile)-lysidine synthase
VIATAHTANDQAETVIMNMMRGTGLRGLGGIPAKRSLGTATLVRPWLEIERSEIEVYLGERKAEYVRDPSNESLEFQRNRVRHQVIPVLRRAFEGRNPVEAVGRMARTMSSLEQYIAPMIERALEHARVPEGLRRDVILGMERYLRYAVLDRWLQESFDYRITNDEQERIDDFLMSESKSLELRGGIRLRKRGELLSIVSNASIPEFGAHRLSVPERFKTYHGTLVVEQVEVGRNGGGPVVLDANHCYLARSCEVVVRAWEVGDRIEAFGMKGRTKLVSDVLLEAGFSVEEKAQYPVVVDERNEVLWVPGVRLSERARQENFNCVLTAITWIAE